jgi:hypothetical protein
VAAALPPWNKLPPAFVFLVVIGSGGGGRSVGLGWGGSGDRVGASDLLGLCTAVLVPLPGVLDLIGGFFLLDGARLVLLPFFSGVSVGELCVSLLSLLLSW